MKGKHRVIRRVIGVVTGRAIVGRAGVAQRIIVADRHRLVMGHEKAELRPRRGTPGVDPRDRAGPLQPDRRLTARIVGVTVFGEPCLMRAPAQFGRLEPFGNEAFHRPGIDEGAARARDAAGLRVALRDMNALDAKRLHQLSPAFAVLGRGGFLAGIAGEGQQRFLDEPRHHPGVRPAAGYRRRPAGVCRLFVADLLAQGVIRTLGVILRLEVEPVPWLHHRIDIENAHLAAELHDIERGGIDAEVHAETFPVGKEPPQDVAIIVARDSDLFVADLALAQEGMHRGIRLHHHQLVRVIIEVAFDQRERALSDGTEADDDDGAVDATVNGIVGHGALRWILRGHKGFGPVLE